MNATIQAYGTGKRKCAKARVFLRPGTGKVTVNGRTMEDYFPRALQRAAALLPFALTSTGESFDALVTVAGGGISAQAEAVRHGLSRALQTHDPALRPTLKANGLLTRDAREVERKIYGQPGSRKRFQFSKR
jgi:small subunit ribosomal protein S9